MGSCFGNNLENNDVLRQETLEEYDINDSIIKELSSNNNFLDELLQTLKFSKEKV
jgi:hypothetical protein